LPTDAPYVATPVPADAARRRRALLISFTFPPDTQIGALRWRKMAHDFARRGWLLDVLATAPALLPKTEASSLADLPPGVRAFGVVPPATAAGRVHRALLGAVRLVRRARGRGASAGGGGAAAAPAGGGGEEGGGQTLRREDVLAEGFSRRALRATYFGRVERAAEGAWVRAAVARAVALGREAAPYDVILTSGPPHAAHVGGRLAAARLGAPLVLDLRDPWTLRRRIKALTASRAALLADEREERAAVEAARLVVLNTEAFRDAMRARYPAQAARMIAVRNGTDREPVPAAAKPARFTIAYAGAIYLDRSPLVLFRALRRAIDALALTPDDIAVEMIGQVFESDGVPTTTLAEREGVAAFVHLGPRRSREEARAFLARAHMLVSLPWDGPLQVPAKVYEIVDFPAWALVFAPPDSAPAQVLAGSGADVVDSDDAAAGAEVLARRYREHRAGVVPTPVNQDGRFDRVHQARVLLDALDEIVPPPDGAPRAGAPGLGVPELGVPGLGVPGAGEPGAGA